MKIRPYVVTFARTSAIFGVNYLGLAWRDSADNTRMSRRVSFAPHEEDRDFVGITDPKWVEEWTHALQQTTAADEVIFTYNAPGIGTLAGLPAARAGHVGDLFPMLFGAVNLRPFVRLVQRELVDDLDKAAAEHTVRARAIQLADIAEQLFAARVIPEDALEARSVAEKIERGGM